MEPLNICLGLLAIALATVGVRAERPDYTKIKTDMELKSSQVVTSQKEVLKKIDKGAEKVIKEGENVLSEFKTNVTSLIPYLSQATSEPFLDNIQEYINSKNSHRQEIIKIITDTRTYQEKAANELKESEKRYNKMLEYLTSGGDVKKNVKHALTHYKSLGLTKERLVEIKEKLLEFEPLLKEKVEKINTSNKKLKVYRLFLDMVRRTRKIVAESKKAYVDSFATKDKVLDGSNRMHSLYKRAKLIMGEAKNKELYKVEIDKLNLLSEDLNQIKENIGALVKNTTKTMEHMHLTFSKAEGYEKSIIEEGKVNRASLTKGYTRGKEIYYKLLKLKGATDEDIAALEQYKKETFDLLKRGNELVSEMEGINKRKSKIARKSLNLSTPHDLRTLVDLETPVTEASDSDESDAESIVSLDSVSTADESSSSSEDDAKKAKVTKKTEKAKATKSSKETKKEKSVKKEKEKAKAKAKKPTKSKEDKALDDLDIEKELEKDSELKAKTKRMRTKSERDKLRDQAIARYLEDIEGGDKSDSDSESSTPSSVPSSDDGKDKKKKKKGLIRKGFSFLKKLALNPESLIDSAEEPYFSASEDAKEELAERRRSGDSTRRSSSADRERAEQARRRQESESQADYPREPEFEDTEEYRQAVRDSISLDLENKARREMERLRSLGFTDEKSRVDRDIYRLVELSYLLKKQFELVRDELKSSLSMNAVDVLKNTLKGLLHQHLSSVCSVALDLTRPSPFNRFNISEGRVNGAVPQSAAAGASYYSTDVGKPSGSNTNNLGQITPGSAESRVSNGRVADSRLPNPPPGARYVGTGPQGPRPAVSRPQGPVPQSASSPVPSAPPAARTANAATNTEPYPKPATSGPQTRQSPSCGVNPRTLAPGQSLHQSISAPSPTQTDSPGFKSAYEVGIGSVPPGMRPVNRLVGNRVLVNGEGRPQIVPRAGAPPPSRPAPEIAPFRMPLWSGSESETETWGPSQSFRSGFYPPARGPTADVPYTLTRVQVSGNPPVQPSQPTALPRTGVAQTGGQSYQPRQFVPQTQQAQQQPGPEPTYSQSPPRQYEPGDVRNKPRYEPGDVRNIPRQSQAQEVYRGSPMDRQVVTELVTAV